jgi:nucleoside-diphosphate-sugar epimerase
LTINKSTVLIAGAGDLGLRLGRRLAPHFNVVGVRRRSFFDFKQGQAQHHDFDGDWSRLLTRINPQKVVISWAPSERGLQAYRACYVDELSRLLLALSHQTPVELLQVSSSAVWECDDGRSIDDRAHFPAPHKERSLILMEAENLTRAYGTKTNNNVCILRLSGLYGPQRWPGLRRLRGASPITENPNGWVNLLHVEDASEACQKALNLHLDGTYLVSAESIERKTLYEFAHRHFGTAPPHWETENFGLGRQIDSSVFKQASSWTPQYPSVCEWIAGQDLDN